MQRGREANLRLTQNLAPVRQPAIRRMRGAVLQRSNGTRPPRAHTNRLCRPTPAETCRLRSKTCSSRIFCLVVPSSCSTWHASNASCNTAKRQEATTRDTCVACKTANSAARPSKRFKTCSVNVPRTRRRKPSRHRVRPNLPQIRQLRCRRRRRCPSHGRENRRTRAQNRIGRRVESWVGRRPLQA